KYLSISTLLLSLAESSARITAKLIKKKTLLKKIPAITKPVTNTHTNYAFLLAEWLPLKRLSPANG
ncbi:MAG: hypothetical protein ACTH5M_04220, partial [Psychrobacter sp.]|uniref:hypothetical protein n=1 Tax=Psychrobacter sp. AOP7-B1-24 TaxID=3457645 RepID=UPI003FBA212E